MIFRFLFAQPNINPKNFALHLQLQTIQILTNDVPDVQMLNLCLSYFITSVLRMNAVRKNDPLNHNTLSFYNYEHPKKGYLPILLFLGVHDCKKIVWTPKNPVLVIMPVSTKQCLG